MFRASCYRRVSLLVLAGYLASGTLGMLVHEHLHDHGHAGEHAAVETGCHEHHHDHAHSAGDVADHDRADHRHGEQETALHDDDCVVCRLAGQRTIETPVAEPAACSGLCCMLSMPAVTSPALATPGLAQSRAPPTLG